jgi:hypothetical protein
MSFGPTPKYDPGSTSHLSSPVPASPPHAPLTSSPPRTGDPQRFQSREPCDCKFTDYRRRCATSGRSAVGIGGPQPPPEGRVVPKDCPHSPRKVGGGVPRHVWSLTTTRTLLDGPPGANPRASARCTANPVFRSRGSFGKGIGRNERPEPTSASISPESKRPTKPSPSAVLLRLPSRRPKPVRSHRCAVTDATRLDPEGSRLVRRLPAPKGRQPARIRRPRCAWAECRRFQLRRAVGSRLRSVGAASRPMNAPAVGSGEPLAWSFEPQRATWRR